MTVRRPYQSPPNFDTIRVMVCPDGVSSKVSLPKCLLISNSYATQRLFLRALLSIRVKEDVRDWPSDAWIPMHELMNCISALYQIMFQRIQAFIKHRIKLLQKMVRKPLIPVDRRYKKLMMNRNLMDVYIHLRSNFNTFNISKIN